MGDKTIYYISEAAKKVQVENHVLRYWEEELELPIKRNEMGHRYYTEEDVKQLQEIKLLKEQGLQLKAIRTVLFKMPDVSDSGTKEQPTARLMDGTRKSKEGTESVQGCAKECAAQPGKSEMRRDKLMDMVKERVEEKTEELGINKAHRYVVALSGNTDTAMEQKQDEADAEKNQKAARLQYLLQHMITEAVRSANRELCTEVKESILKELDYQFRMQEERDDERWKMEEEHYRKIDEMIRERHKPKEKLGRGRKKA